MISMDMIQFSLQRQEIASFLFPINDQVNFYEVLDKCNFILVIVWTRDTCNIVVDSRVWHNVSYLLNFCAWVMHQRGTFQYINWESTDQRQIWTSTMISCQYIFMSIYQHIKLYMKMTQKRTGEKYDPLQEFVLGQYPFRQ